MATNQSTQKKIVARFDLNRHRFIKFLTFGLSGHQFLDQLSDTRDELRTRFNRVRRTKFWNNYVDGGMWFFEITTKTLEFSPQDQYSLDGSISSSDNISTIEINPHMHCLLLSPKKIPIYELNEVFAEHGLGHCYITAPNTYARAGDQTNPPGLEASINYVMGYLKKETQIDGRNRQTFGCLRN